MCFKCLYLEGSLHDFQCAGRFGNSYSETVTSSFNTEYKGCTWISPSDNQKKLAGVAGKQVLRSYRQCCRSEGVMLHMQNCKELWIIYLLAY